MSLGDASSATDFQKTPEVQVDANSLDLKILTLLFMKQWRLPTLDLAPRAHWQCLAYSCHFVLTSLGSSEFQSNQRHGILPSSVRY